MSGSSSVVTSTSLRRFLSGLVDSEGSLTLATILAILFPNLVILNLGRVCSGLDVSGTSLSCLSSSTLSFVSCCDSIELDGSAVSLCSPFVRGSSFLFLLPLIVKSRGPSVSSLLTSVLTLFAQ